MVNADFEEGIPCQGKNHLVAPPTTNVDHLHTGAHKTMEGYAASPANYFGVASFGEVTPYAVFNSEPPSCDKTGSAKTLRDECKRE